MNRLRRIAYTALALVAVLLLTGLYRFLDSRGIFNRSREAVPATCRLQAETGAVADIASDGKTAYIAAGKGLFLYAGEGLKKLAGTPKTSRIAALSLGRGAAFLRAVLIEGDGHFAVSLFRLKPEGVEELGRISTDMLASPTAIAAPDGERFYIVNHSESRTGLGRWLDDVLLLPRAHLLWFDGMKFVAVAEHLNSPSGLALSADGSHLYIAQDFPRTVVGTARSDFTGAIDNPSALSLPAGPQKLSLAPDGSLIVAARPAPGSGAVYRLRLENGAPQSAEALFATGRAEVRAAAELPGKLLVGTDKALVVCEP